MFLDLRFFIGFYGKTIAQVSKLFDILGEESTLISYKNENSVITSRAETGRLGCWETSFHRTTSCNFQKFSFLVLTVKKQTNEQKYNSLYFLL